MKNRNIRIHNETKRIKRGLTIKQSHMLNIIKEFIDQHSYSPSIRELAELANGITISNTHRYIVSLKDRGHINYQPGQQRSIHLI